jgi:hypothetical protein
MISIQYSKTYPRSKLEKSAKHLRMKYYHLLTISSLKSFSKQKMREHFPTHFLKPSIILIEKPDQGMIRTLQVDIS